MHFPEEWPEDWPEEQRQELRNALAQTGAIEDGFIRYMAHELDAQGATIHDFIHYVSVMQHNAAAMAKHQMDRQRLLGPFQHMMDGLRPRAGEPALIGLLKAFLSVLIGLLVFFCTVLPRLYYWWHIRRHEKFHAPWFRLWWQENKPSEG